MAAEKIRIHEIAKELKLPSKEVISILSEKLGIEVKSHSSAVSMEEATKLKVLLEKKNLKLLLLKKSKNLK